ncbi:MAG: 4-hydroxy-2-oxovalerate aldolase [Anaerorhabdus sp.]|uniref:4-hydroxy-2-oxovalerate aldolase n=1 Tax=Anaerorhabdus sp. TaxID=1872524 RepID=UPI003A84F54B
MLKVVDTTLRDGSHAISHSYTVEQVRNVAAALDEAGVDIIEISHGDGLAGSSINYGFSTTDELELVKAASEVVKNAQIGVLLLPGIGTIVDLEKAYEAGARVVRIATHVTEADVAIEHIKYAKEKGMFTVGFLMMVHMASPEKIVEQAKIFEENGVDYINLADSAGHLTPNEVKERIEAIKAACHVPVGFHAHNNLGLAIANSITAIESGVDYIDATCCGLGAGAGNCQLEVLSAVLNRLNIENKLDFKKLLVASEDIVRPLLQRPQQIDAAALMLGYAGVYSSFLLHAKRAADTYGITVVDILEELGKRKMVGGQEDMIVDVAYHLANK